MVVVATLLTGLVAAILTTIVITGTIAATRLHAIIVVLLQSGSETFGAEFIVIAIRLCGSVRRIRRTLSMNTRTHGAAVAVITLVASGLRGRLVAISAVVAL